MLNQTPLIFLFPPGTSLFTLIPMSYLVLISIFLRYISVYFDCFDTRRNTQKNFALLTGSRQKYSSFLTKICQTVIRSDFS